MSTQKLCREIFGSIAHAYKKRVIFQMSINGWIGRQSMVSPCNKYYFAKQRNKLVDAIPRMSLDKHAE